MKLDKIFLASFAAMALAGCTQEDVPGVQPTPGKDVVFGASALQTKTEYQTPNEDGSYPIWWLPGDQMLVMSPQCAIKHGQYEVSKEVYATGSASAGTLQKIGNAGVQWGTSETADFYSVYPYKKVEADGIKPDSKTVTMRMPHIQNDYIQNNGGTYTAKADMDASFLYAQTNGVKNGLDVQLGYKSLSTAIRFTLVGPQSASAQDAQIQYIKITSANNVKIAGKMDVQFYADASMPAVKFDSEDSYDQVYVYSSYQGATSGGYLTLKRNESIELNVFVMPENDCNINGWEIEVKTLTKTYRKTLGSGELKRGMIHNLGKLPALEADNEGEWQTENWMVNIPRNTYLSEISIPGSWNSMNSDFQSVTDLTEQYKVGVRAFHLDCRWKDTTTLGIAAGKSSNSSGSGWETSGKVTNGSSFQDALNTVVSQVKPDEYMVVYCTFAQNSAKPSGKTWEQAVSEACNNITLAQGSTGSVADATKINSKTTVGEVLNKVIVIVNTEGTIPTIPGSKCFFINAPLNLKTSMFGDGVYGHDVMHYGSGASDITMFTSQCQVEFEKHNVVYGSQGNDNSARGYLPTPAQRSTQLNDILSWSQNNYATNKDNAITSNWIYLGIGGYRGAYGSLTEKEVNAVDGSYTAIAQTYNNWINGKVTNMSATPTGNQTGFYPVGIVLMNFVTDTTYGTPTVKNILLLNNRFQKAFDPNQPAWPETGGTPNNAPKREAFSSVMENGWDVF